jgi:2-polyprenyl-3-methyl-5-hydroxy-6-metoxy-1,4-benzoquinol methylase
MAFLALMGIPGIAMNLSASRRRASELSGGTSSQVIRGLVRQCLQEEGARGSLLDFGAGRGELLGELHAWGAFDELAGIDLFARPSSLPPGVQWYEHDLNDSVPLDRHFDVVVCSETIEHLENPRHVFRSLYALVRPGGVLVLTMPNNESIRSIAGLLFAGHFTQFLGACYPAHITALLRLDLARLCAETGFAPPRFRYTNTGGIPKAPTISWQRVSFGRLRGRLFSDNVGMITRR